MKKAVRTIGVLGIILNIAQICIGIYSANIYQSLSGTGQIGPIGSISGTGFYIGILLIIVGIIGLISCIGLLLLKEWGFILFYIYALGSGLWNGTQTNTLLAQLIQWLPFILVSIFLIFQERRLFHLQNQSPS